MEEFYVFLSILSAIIFLIIIICFFKLCSNVSKIKKSILSDSQEYMIQKKIGNIEKAYYHLQRDFILNFGKNGVNLETYYSHFKNLGRGIPDFKEFNKFDTK